MELWQTVETRARRAQRAGQRWAARIIASKDAAADPAGTPTDDDADDPLDRAAVRVTDVFTRMGFAAELDPRTNRRHRRRPLIVRNRPRRNGSFDCTPARYRELARSHPEVVCGYIGDCCRACWSTSGRRASKAASTAMSVHLFSRSSNPNCVWRGWWRGECCPVCPAARADVVARHGGRDFLSGSTDQVSGAGSDAAGRAGHRPARVQGTQRCRNRFAAATGGLVLCRYTSAALLILLVSVAVVLVIQVVVVRAPLSKRTDRVLAGATCHARECIGPTSRWSWPRWAC